MANLNYKGFDYETFGKGYSIFFEGDEIYFDTEKEVHEFIDSIITFFA